MVEGRRDQGQPPAAAGAFTVDTGALARGAGSSGARRRVSSPPAVPIYHHVREALRGRVEGGEFTAERPVPTEAELMTQYGVSRTTIREAILGLVREGLLYRQRGRGTFVAAPKIEEELGALRGFTERMEVRGLRPRATVLSKTTVGLGGREAELLGVPEGAQAFRIVRLRLVDDVPHSIETAIFPFDIGLRITQEDLDEIGYYPLLEERYGIRLSSAEQVLEARRATSEESTLLQLPRGAPVLEMERVTSDVSGRRIELSRGVFRADRYRYRIRLRR